MVKTRCCTLLFLQRFIDSRKTRIEERDERRSRDRHVLINGLNENARSDLRVREVNNLNDMHAINGLGTNDDLMYVDDGIVRESESRMNEILNIVSEVNEMRVSMKGAINNIGIRGMFQGRMYDAEILGAVSNVLKNEARRK